MHSCRIGDFDNDMVSTLSIEMDFLLASSNEGYADTIEDFVIQHIGEGTFDCSEEGKKSKVNEWTRRARDIGVTYLHVIKVLPGELLVSNQTKSKFTYHCVLSATKNLFLKSHILQISVRMMLDGIQITVHPCILVSELLLL